MKKLTFWKSLFLLFALIVGTSTSWADDETINFSTLGLENSVQYTDPFGTNISVTFGGGGNDGKYYTTGTGIRTYGNGTITITAKGKTVTKIETTFSDSDHAPAATTVWSSNGTNSKTSSGTSATWEGSATEVVMTRPSGSGHWRLQVIKVTYTPADPREAVNVNSLTFNPTSIVVGGATSQATAGNDKTACTTATYAYESLDKDIATCTAAGVITAVAKGTARIKATMSIPNDDPDYRVGTATITEEITVSNPSHNAIFMSNGAEYNRVSVEEGEDITFPTNPADLGGKTFVGWTDEPISGTADNVDLVTSAEMGNSDVTYYAVFATATSSLVTITDDITLSDTGVSGTSYKSWTNLSITTDAVYAGNNAGGNDAIQLRSSTSSGSSVHSGIVSTTSGGKVKKITVEWNSNTSGKTLDVYGKNTAYTSVENLYDSSSATQGTKLGNIVEGTSTVLSVTGDYTYVGLRSNSGAMYLDKISIEWEAGSTTYSDFCTTVTKTLNLNTSGYATYSDAFDFEVSSGAKAYKAILNTANNKITCSEIEGKIKAGEGVLLYGENGATVTLLYTTGASALTDNDLKGTTTSDGSLATMEGSKYYYALSGDTFKHFTGAAFAANKAFFESATELNSKTFAIVFEGETTAINGIEEVVPVVTKTRKVVKNGRLVIETANGEFTIDGARMK